MEKDSFWFNGPCTMTNLKHPYHHVKSKETTCNPPSSLLLPWKKVEQHVLWTPNLVQDSWWQDSESYTLNSAGIFRCWKLRSVKVPLAANNKLLQLNMWWFQKDHIICKTKHIILSLNSTTPSSSWLHHHHHHQKVNKFINRIFDIKRISIESISHWIIWILLRFKGKRFYFSISALDL